MFYFNDLLRDYTKPNGEVDTTLLALDLNTLVHSLGVDHSELPNFNNSRSLMLLITNSILKAAVPVNSVIKKE